MNVLAFFNLIKACGVGAFICVCASLYSVYVPVYQSIENGAVVFTGNTLGLDKITDQNNPGTRGSIGAFITQDSSQHVNSYPNGTTLDFRVNGSTAYLDIPPGSVVLHAELVWFGRYGDDGITIPLIDSTEVNLTLPGGGIHNIAPKPNYPIGTGQSVFISSFMYVRSQDVTSLVAADVHDFFALQPNDFYSQEYIVGGVPGTVNRFQNFHNCAGWVLMVAYENPRMVSSQLLLYVAAEASGAAAVNVSGFTTPNSGDLMGRVFVSSVEGDPQVFGDQLRLGPGVANPPTSVLAGTNNPANNFFSSQINTLLNVTTDPVTNLIQYSGSGLLDTRGSFGTINSNPFTGFSPIGGRVGVDITSVDISNELVHSQTDLYVQGVSSNDVFALTSMGLMIQQNSPVLSSKKTASSSSVNVKDELIFIIQIENIGTSSATDLTFFDVLPPGLTFIGPLTLSKNGGASQVIPINPNDLNTGVDLSPYVANFDVNDSITIQLVVNVDTYYSSYTNTGTLRYNFFPSLNGVSQTNEVTINGTSLKPPPENFIGHIEKCEFLNKNEYRLLATWAAPSSTTTTLSAYRIYCNGVLVQTIPASGPLVFEKCSSSKKSLYGYEIASVSEFGVESQRIKIDIVKG